MNEVFAEFDICKLLQNFDHLQHLHCSCHMLTGSVKSLISLPCFMSHASIPAEVRQARGLTEDLVRISVGIEDVNDLIADLDHALRTGLA